MILGGVFGFFCGTIAGTISAALSLAVGLVGLVASYRRDLKWLRYFLYMLCIIFVIQALFLLGFFIYQEYKYESNVDTGACDNSADPAKCRETFRKFGRWSHVSAFFMELAIMVIIDIWLILVVNSFVKVVELGGTGDEQLSPEQYSESLGNPGQSATAATPLRQGQP